jgi:hypothetical protein
MSSYRVRSSYAALVAAGAAALFTIGVPATSAEPATDALGFVDSTARCAPPNTAAAFGSTAESRVAICKSPAGLYGYHGVRVSDGAKLIASATVAADGSYVAQSDGITYTVTSSALVVSDANGVIRREPMLSYHGPKTAQAPAGTQKTPGGAPQSPSTAPAAPQTSTAPSTPLPPPLPAEVGGKH